MRPQGKPELTRNWPKTGPRVRNTASTHGLPARSGVGNRSVYQDRQLAGERERGVPLEPTRQLSRRHKHQPAPSDQPEFGLDVTLERIHRKPKRCGCLGLRQRQPGHVRRVFALRTTWAGWGLAGVL